MYDPKRRWAIWWLFLHCWKNQNFVGLRNGKYNSPMTNLHKKKVGTASSLQNWSFKVWYPLCHDPKALLAIYINEVKIEQKMHFIHENINFSENGGHWRPPKFMNVPDELRNTLFMFWEAQKYISCKVLFDWTLWPPLEDHLASNEPP